MKKLASRFTVLFVLAALLVSGIVFSVSAQERDNTVASKSVASVELYSGKRNTGTAASPSYTGIWETGSLTNVLSSAPSNIKFWPSFDADGNKTEDGAYLWYDFEYYYDHQVKSDMVIKMRSGSGSKPNQQALLLSNGTVSFSPDLF